MAYVVLMYVLTTCTHLSLTHVTLLPAVMRQPTENLYKYMRCLH